MKLDSGNFWESRIRERAKVRPLDRFFSDPRGSVNSRQYDEETSRLLAVFSRCGIGVRDRIVVTLPRGTALALVGGAALRGTIAFLNLARYEVLTAMASVCETLEPRAVISLASDPVTRNSGFVADSVHEDEIRIGSEKLSIRIEIHSGPRKKGPEDLAWLLQTSGSTRSPRLVMISDENLVTRAQGEVRDFSLSQKDILLNFLTFAHDLGLNQFFSTLASGAELQIQNQPFIASLAQSLSENTSTGITGTPLMWKQLFYHLNESGQHPRYESLRFATVSGGSLDESSLQELSALFPRAEIFRTYGQTETFRSLFHRGLKTHSLGKPLSDVQLHLESDGELIHRGAGQMLGYFGNEHATQEKLQSDGIHTGDIFKVDSSGEYHYIGRKDDLVKRFEYRLHLGEIEEVLKLLPTVSNAVLISRPAKAGDLRGTLLRAFVQSKAPLSEDEVLRHCKAHLAPNKIPDSIHFVEGFPATESRKIDRLKLLGDWLKEDE